MTEIGRLEIAVAAGDALIREILEALCRRDGLPAESSVVPGEPARNYELALRLGIGHVFGIEEPVMSGKPLPEPLVPWHVRAIWRVWGWVTWPVQARQLKREGWRRTGWMQWESPR